MPPLPDVPSVLKVQLNYTIGVDTLNLTRLFFRYGGTAPTASALNTWCAALSLNWGGSMGGLTSVGTSMTRVSAVDLTTTSSAQGSDSTARVGTRSGSPLPASTSFLVSYHLNRRYRGGKPRSYLPIGVATDTASGQTWGASFVTSVTSGWNTFLGYITANPPAGVTSLVQVNVSYYKGFTVFTTSTGRAKNIPTLRPTPLVDTVSSVTYSNVFASQRERERKQPGLFRLFSTPFISIQGLNGTSAPVPVPNGHVYVVKQLTSYAKSDLVGTSVFFRNRTTGAALWHTQVPLSEEGWFGFYGALVFRAGEEFEFFVDTAPVQAADVYAGGYDLLIDE